jgi:hypothetical protein
MVWEAFMAAALWTNFWVPGTPEVLLYTYIPTMIVSTFILLFNAFWMGSLKRYKRDNLTTEQMWDRLLRAGGDQWLSTVVLGASGFLLIWMTSFYKEEGIAPWRPIPLAPTGPQIENRGIVKGFELATLAICAGAYLITMCPSADSLKRHMFAMTNSGGEAVTGSLVESKEYKAALVL